MGILKDKLNKLIGKKNPINSIPAVLGDLLGDIVDSVENNGGSTSQNNYDLELENLENGVAITSSQLYKPIMQMLMDNLGATEEDIIDLCKTQFGATDENLESVLLVLFTYIMIVGSASGVNISFKINLKSVIPFGEKYSDSINKIVNLTRYMVSSERGVCLYGYIPEFDMYLGLCIVDSDINHLSGAYFMHNFISGSGSAIINLSNHNIKDTDNIDVLDSFNYWLNNLKIKYANHNYGIYYRIFNSDYFYSVDTNYKLNLENWELEETNWTLP